MQISRVYLFWVILLSFQCCTKAQPFVTSPAQINATVQPSDLDLQMTSSTASEVDVADSSALLKPTPCNLNVILYAHQQIENLSPDFINLFMKVLEVDCSDNVEYSQFSNEVLFMILHRYANKVVEVISDEKYDMAVVLSKTASPLLDPPLKQIVSTYLRLGSKNSNVALLVSALQSAILYDKITFVQKGNFDIIDYELSVDTSSSDTDLLQCTKWQLSTAEIKKILSMSTPIDGHQWHYLFDHLPCSYKGSFVQNNQTYKFEINAGSWLSIQQADTTITFGDIHGLNQKLFLRPKIDFEERQKHD